MDAPALTADELAMVRAVFRRHPEVSSAILFGSRAKGTHRAGSDVDLALQPLSGKLSDRKKSKAAAPHVETNGARRSPSTSAAFACRSITLKTAVTGQVAPLRAEAIAAELGELPLPYRFEVQPLAHIQSPPLREHVRRAGIRIYPESIEGELRA